MGISLESLQRFVAIGQSAQQAVDQVIRRASLGLLPDAAIDRAILERLPIATQATYRHGDRWDAIQTLSRLRTFPCSSIVDAVCIEINAELLRERRAGR